jgi:addiction module RelE/StbE family toxin
LAEIRYSPEAKGDLLEIKRYINDELQNPSAAERTVSKITRSARMLEKSPQIGTPLSSVTDIDTDYRFLLAGNYLLFYRYVEDVCYIDRVLYQRRDCITVLFGSG